MIIESSQLYKYDRCLTFPDIHVRVVVKGQSQSTNNKNKKFRLHCMFSERQNTVIVNKG